MSISRINSKDSPTNLPYSAIQKKSTDGAVVRASLSSASFTESKSCIQMVLDFFSSLFNAIKNLICCASDVTKQSRTSDVTEQKKAALSEKAIKEMIHCDRRSADIAEPLLTSIQNSQLSSCKYKKILVSGFRDGEAWLYFTEADGRYRSFKFEEYPEGSVLLIGISLAKQKPLTEGDVNHQDRFGDFIKRGNTYTTLTTAEYLDLTIGKLPDHLLKTLQS